MFKKIATKITRGRIEQFVSNHASDNVLVLDLGSRNSPYRKYFKNIIGMDILSGNNVDVVGDAHMMPFDDNKFDIILCIEAMEHFYNPMLAITEMKRVLKNDGTLILSTRFIFPIHDAPNDYYRYTKYGLRKLFSDWDIVSLHEEANTKDTIAILIQRIGYQSKLVGGLFTKFLLFLLARVIYLLPSIIKSEFGDYAKTIKEDNILSSGYYMICRNKK